MDSMTQFDPIAIGPDAHALPAWVPLPGMGVLTVNAFVIRAREPVLVDTGLAPLAEAFLGAVSSVIDPEDLRWVWLTHIDADHIGNLARIMELAPQAKVVTSYLGMGKLSLTRPLPPERAYLINPGQALDVGDRTLFAVRPPTFDAPETTALFDAGTGSLYSSDCFGGLLPDPVVDAADIPLETLREGVVTWATVDSPWLHDVQPERFAQRLDTLRSLSPTRVLSSHLPPAGDVVGRLLAYLDEARGAGPFVGPDQAALMAMAGVA